MFGIRTHLSRSTACGWQVGGGQKQNKWSHGQYIALIYYMIHHSKGKEASFNPLIIPPWLGLTSSTEVLDSISCNARTDRDCSRMKQQIARSGGTFWNTGQPVNPPPQTAAVESGAFSTVSSIYLSVGGGLKEAKTVPESFTRQAQLDLLLEDGRGALQHHLVIL